MKCKLKAPQISTMILAVVLVLLFYQSFFVIPGLIEDANEKIELFACSTSPIYAMKQAIRENIATGDEYGTASPGLLCMTSGEMFTSNSFPDVDVTFELATDSSQAEEYLEVTSESLTALKGVVFTAYVDCQSGAPNSCKIEITPVRALDT